MTRKTCFAAVLAIAAFAAPAVAPAAILIDFQPVTDGPNVQFTGTPGTKTLTVTSSAINLRSNVDVPTLSGPIVDGYEIFENSTLTFTFQEAGPGISLGGGAVFETLIGGNFTITSSPAFGNAVLLSGTFGPSNLFGTVAIGSVMSPTVAYTGGLISTVLPVPTGDSILGLSLVSPAFSVAGASVNDFTARLQGQLTTPVIPEPASVGTIGLAASAFLSRRRRA